MYANTEYILDPAPVEIDVARSPFCCSLAAQTVWAARLLLLTGVTWFITRRLNIIVAMASLSK